MYFQPDLYFINCNMPQGKNVKVVCEIAALCSLWVTLIIFRQKQLLLGWQLWCLGYWKHPVLSVQSFKCGLQSKMDSAVWLSLTSKDQFVTSLYSPWYESWRANIRHFVSLEKVIHVTHPGNIQVTLPGNKKRNETKCVIRISVKRF